jgi:hypothetical protein
MGLRGLYFPQIGGKINPGPHPTDCRIDIFLARALNAQRENKVTVVKQTQIEELRTHEEKRDFFVSSATPFVSLRAAPR